MSDMRDDIEDAVVEVYNRATGKHEKPRTKKDALEWWSRKLGFGNERGGGALAKRRKKALDKQIEKGGG